MSASRPGHDVCGMMLSDSAAARRSLPCAYRSGREARGLITQSLIGYNRRPAVSASCRPLGPQVRGTAESGSLAPAPCFGNARRKILAGFEERKITCRCVVFLFIFDNSI